MFEKHFQKDERGAIEAIGFFLIFSIIVLAVALTVVTLTGAMQDQKESYRAQTAEKGMTLLSDAAEDIYQGDTPKRVVELKLNGGQVEAAEKAVMEVTVENTANGEQYTFGPEPSKAITLRTADTLIAYENGALMRIDDSGKAYKGYISAFMVEEPPMHFSTSRTVVRVVDLQGEGARSGEGRIRAEMTHHRTELKYHGSAADPDYDVTVRIETSRSRAIAWEQYFQNKGLEDTGNTNIDEGIVEYEYTTEEIVVQRHIIDVEII